MPDRFKWVIQKLPNLRVTRMRVLHRKMKLTGKISGFLPEIRENRKVSGSPPGEPPPDIFPS
jgi:hypothetical protein